MAALWGEPQERPTHDATPLTRNVMGAGLKPDATGVGNSTTRAIQSASTPTQGASGAGFKSRLWDEAQSRHSRSSDDLTPSAVSGQQSESALYFTRTSR